MHISLITINGSALRHPALNYCVILIPVVVVYIHGSSYIGVVGARTKARVKIIHLRMCVCYNKEMFVVFGFTFKEVRSLCDISFQS